MPGEGAFRGPPDARARAVMPLRQKRNDPLALQPPRVVWVLQLQSVVEEVPGPAPTCQRVPHLLPLLIYLAELGRAPAVRPFGRSLKRRPSGRIIPRNARLPCFTPRAFLSRPLAKRFTGPDPARGPHAALRRSFPHSWRHRKCHSRGPFATQDWPDTAEGHDASDCHGLGGAQVMLGRRQPSLPGIVKVSAGTPARRHAEAAAEAIQSCQ